jgi:hypothetical protein
MAKRVDLGPHLARVESRGLQLALHVAADFVDFVRGHLDPEVLGGHVLDEVGFVQDQGVIGGNDLAVVAVLHREVGAEKVVVDHHDVRLQGALAHARHPAGIEVGAGLADAVLARRGDLAPEVHGVRQVGDLAAIAGGGARDPRLHRAVEGDLVEAPKAARLPEGPMPLHAQVVAPPLHDRHVQLAAEGPGQDGDVLVEELLLQVLGASRDHDPAPEMDGGKEVGQGLAGAGAGFGEEEPAVVEGPLHRFGQGALRRPLLVVRQRAGQEPAGTEERRDGARTHAGHLSR